MNKAKILFLDIESTPNLSYTWGKWEQNVIEFEKEWYILCMAYKWGDEKRTNVISLPDYKTYKKDKSNDRELVVEIHKLFEEADIIVGHNAQSFDIKKINARFLYHGLPPPSPYRVVDTLKLARRHFSFNSNKLNDLSKHLSLGEKSETGGFETWLGCMAGDEKAWTLMKRYNKQDVVLLYEVYQKMRGWIVNGPNHNLYQGTTQCCPNCGSKHVHSRGVAVTKLLKYTRYQCQTCAAWFKGEKLEMNKIEYK